MSTGNLYVGLQSTFHTVKWLLTVLGRVTMITDDGSLSYSLYQRIHNVG